MDMITIGGVLYDVVPQNGNHAFVTSFNDKVTRFEMATQFGCIGILAHNYTRAGGAITNLKVGDKIKFHSGSTRTFTVKEIHSFRAVSPNYPYSDFEDVDTGAIYGVGHVFRTMYDFAADGRSWDLTLQTCITRDHVSNWGRRFVCCVEGE